MFVRMASSLCWPLRRAILVCWWMWWGSSGDVVRGSVMWSRPSSRTTNHRTLQNRFINLMEQWKSLWWNVSGSECLWLTPVKHLVELYINHQNYIVMCQFKNWIKYFSSAISQFCDLASKANEILHMTGDLYRVDFRGLEEALQKVASTAVQYVRSYTVAIESPSFHSFRWLTMYVMWDAVFWWHEHQRKWRETSLTWRIYSALRDLWPPPPPSCHRLALAPSVLYVNNYIYTIIYII